MINLSNVARKLDWTPDSFRFVGSLRVYQMSNPDSVVTVLTDKVSVMPTSKLPADVRIHRTSDIFDRNNLMLQRLQSYCVSVI